MANTHSYLAGLGNVASYQASSRPYLSSSISVSGNFDVVEISFPTVTKFITVKNIGPTGSNYVDLRVGFSAYGVSGSNYLAINNQESFSADWKVSKVYLRIDSGSALTTAATINATASVIAGLTGIDAYELTHNWTGSMGVG